MPLIVKKFGGTSLANLNCIAQVADRIVTAHRQGEQIVVVVSAMAGTTNQLVHWAKEAGGTFGDPEYDVVASAGEGITAGLLALALQKRGLKSRSWNALQLPVLTSADHGEAVIEKVPTDGLLSYAAAGGISVVTGFQGVTTEGRLTTLGRGGSDTTAVALAGFLQADRCDIYTDVDGVYTADPRFVSDAQKISRLSYDEMLLLSSNGAKVLHPQAVYTAQKYAIPLRVLSSFSFQPGTLISVDGGGDHLFGLTYTLGWTLVESEVPFCATPFFASQDILFQAACAFPLFRAIFLEKDPEAADLKALTGRAATRVRNNLAALSVMMGGCNHNQRRALRLRFLGALSDPTMPPVQMRATQARQWQLWVEEEDLPAALRLMHHRLQGMEGIQTS